MDELIECPECQGEGELWIETRNSCTKYIGDCCGGCGYMEQCETCSGHGELNKKEFENYQIKNIF